MVNAIIGNVKTHLTIKRNNVFVDGGNYFNNIYCEKCRNFTKFPSVEIWWKAQFPHSFGRIAQNYAKTVPVYKISTPGN